MKEPYETNIPECFCNTYLIIASRTSIVILNYFVNSATVNSILQFALRLLYVAIGVGLSAFVGKLQV